MTLADYLHKAIRNLHLAGIDNPRLSAHVLAQAILCPPDAAATPPPSATLFCLMAAQRELTPQEEERLDAVLAQRAQGCPVAYLTGHREFYGRDFCLNRHTLIPRPETELLVECALTCLPRHACLVADMGTGSGCIGITLAAERPTWQVLLLDKSAAALDTARRNGERWGVTQRSTFLVGDMFHPPLRPACLDALVGNPPYISPTERGEVMDEVRHWEPPQALFSGHKGLRHLTALVRTATQSLKPGGWIVLEHGARQGEAVRTLLAQAGVFTAVQTLPDLAGWERCTRAQKR